HLPSVLHLDLGLVVGHVGEWSSVGFGVLIVEAEQRVGQSDAGPLGSRVGECERSGVGRSNLLSFSEATEIGSELDVVIAAQHRRVATYGVGVADDAGGIVVSKQSCAECISRQRSDVRRAITAIERKDLR